MPVCMAMIGDRFALAVRPPMVRGFSCESTPSRQATGCLHERVSCLARSLAWNGEGVDSMSELAGRLFARDRLDQRLANGLELARAAVEGIPEATFLASTTEELLAHIQPNA
jgi:hypothetical protein